MEAMLPPLSPLTVVKAPLLRERPQERGSADSQEMLLTLLKKRRKKYLARTRDYTEGGKKEPEKKSYELIPPSLYSDESSIKSFAEHVIKCAKRRRKKSIKSQRRIGRNGTIISKAPVKVEQITPTHQAPRNRHVLQDKLSSPLKQEIRTIYRLNVTKHDMESKKLEADGSQSPQKKPMASSPLATSSPITTSPIASCSVQDDGNPQNNGSCVRRKLMYLSERQSEMSPTIGAPYPPPCTPDNTEWSKFCVPSLHDIKSQRLLKSRLLAIETSVKEKQAKEKDKEIENKKKKELEESTKLKEIQKEIQRNEIYALNKIMAALEETKSSSFITDKV